MTPGRVLLIDTSTRGWILSAVAVRNDLGAGAAGWRVEQVDSSAAQLDSGLPARLAAVVAPVMAGGAALEAVVVTLGPGSYTGVRAGIAAAAGLAAARTLPLHALTTIELVAAGAPAGCSVAWAGIDAGRGGLYVARVALDAGTCRPAGFSSAARVDAASWCPPAGEPLVTLASMGRSELERAVTTAVALGMERPPLDLAVTEPLTVAHRQAGGRQV